MSGLGSETRRCEDTIGTVGAGVGHNEGGVKKGYEKYPLIRDNTYRCMQKVILTQFSSSFSLSHQVYGFRNTANALSPALFASIMVPRLSGIWHGKALERA